MDYGLWGRRRGMIMAVSAAMMLFLVGCGSLGLLPRESKTAPEGFQSFDAVQSAYAKVTPGTTRLGDLQKLGFQTAAAPNVETLSYLGVVERFLPHNTVSYDQLAAPVQACIEAQTRCSALVYRPQHVETRRKGNILLSLFGFEHRTEAKGWSAEVLLLMQDGHVAYKVMRARPHIDEVRNEISPLGPLQAVANTVTRTASRVF